jgi:phage terminase large subunit-like protein
VWADELAAWRYPEAWDMAMMGLRLGKKPQAVVTTTPRPTPIIKKLVKDVNSAITRGTTFDNLVNLAPTFRSTILAKYEGTRLGRQELYAEILEDVVGALWTRDILEAGRVTSTPALRRIVVGVDPEITSGEDAAETGIIVAGVARIAGVDHYYVLDDMSIRETPRGWAQNAVAAYHKYRADRVIAEVNQGGEMVEYTIQTVDRGVPVKMVHASRSKQARAEPISALYEKGFVHHVGYFPYLEDQLCSWVPGEKSPDRLDAMVWALSRSRDDPFFVLRSGPTIYRDCRVIRRI